MPRAQHQRQRVVVTRRWWTFAATALLPVFPVWALAAPGFIAGSFVDSDGHTARLSVQFRCGVEYVSHEPESHGDSLRIRLDSTSICNGVSPGIASIREQYRPIGADDARLVAMEYDGDSPTGQILRLDFNQDVRFDAVRAQNDNTILIQVSLDSADAPAPASPTAPGTTARLVRTTQADATRYVINLQSSKQAFAAADMPKLDLPRKTKVFITDATIDGKLWHRLRVGYFDTADEAARALRQVRARYPSAWIDRADASPQDELPAQLPVETAAEVNTADTVAATPDTEVSQLMADARRSMIAGDLSHAVQIYTKVLQLPPNEYQQEAQEYLGVARERNGQLAHAKAEYEHYLSRYPDGEGAGRVQQRLAALLAVGRSETAAAAATGNGAQSRSAGTSPWNVRTFVSQFYRRDVNQLNDQDQVVSQSSVYSDVSLDVRRRGERFDFSARLTGGHNYDMLDQPTSDTGNVRLSYAYVDLADARTRLRGRLGRQTRNSGGVLGRFDGLDLSYGVTDKVRIDAVAGKPVYSTAIGVDNQRSFVGLSSTFGPIGENLDLGVYVLQQTIDGLTDRQSIGGELRYFGEKQSLWGMMDYDTAFSEISAVFLQGSWRLPSKLTISGVIDRRRSPYLSLGNSMIGQFVEDFSQMKILFDEDTLRQLALDRSALTTTTTLGVSKTLTPKLQLGLNATRSGVDATEASGGVPANPQFDYSYYSLDLVASSIFSERDVSIISMRYSQSGTSDIYTLNLDSRFSVGRAWRINPRLRVDYRDITTDGSTQWSYTPGLRLEYRPGRTLKFELQAGKEFSTRQLTGAPDLNRESYYVSAGYQWFF
jgi:tetratricopeptide (TPR) repeat protein